MRIPLHKVYRAFPEFDRFSDERCEAYMLYVHRRYASRLTTVGILVWLGAIFSTVVGLFPVTRIGTALTRWYSKSAYPPDDLWYASIVLPLAILMLICALAALVVRDIHLRGVMRRQLKGVTCAACSYSLLGAVVSGDSVRCPECGEAFFISARGLRPEDFQVGRDDLPGVADLPPAIRTVTEPPPPDLDPAHKSQLLSRVRTRRDDEAKSKPPHQACTQCGFNLHGLVPLESVLRCPECGQGHAAIDMEQKQRLVRAVEHVRRQVEQRSAPDQRHG